MPAGTVTSPVAMFSVGTGAPSALGAAGVVTAKVVLTVVAGALFNVSAPVPVKALPTTDVTAPLPVNVSSFATIGALPTVTFAVVDEQFVGFSFSQIL